MHPSSPACSTTRTRTHPRDPGGRALHRLHDATPVAGDRAAHAEGLDRTRRRRRRPGPGHVPRASGAALGRARERRPPRDARGVAAQLRARDLSSTRRARSSTELTRARARGRSADGREPARERGPGAACRSTSPTTARTPSTCRSRARCIQESTRRLGEMLRDIYVRNPDELPAVLPRRDAVESARRRVRGREPLHDGSDRAVRRPRGSRRPRHGGAERALLRGMARGLSPQRSPRPVRDLRGVRDGAGVDGRAAREVARRVPAARVARAGGVAQRAAHLDVLAQRPQRVQPSGSRVHRHDAVDAGRRRPRVPAARRELPPVGRRPLLPQPRLRELHRHRQAAPAAVARPRRGA